MSLMMTSALAGAVLLSGALRAEEAPSSLAERHALLRKEFHATSGQIRSARTGEERQDLVRKLVEFPARFVRLAEIAPGEPIALEILRDATQALGSTDSAALLTWETEPARFGSGCQDDSARRIVAILEGHHLRSAELRAVLDRMRYGYRLEFGEFLDKVLAGNPHAPVRAEACIARGLALADRLEMIRLAEARPALWDCYERVFGNGFVHALRGWDKAGVQSRIENLLELAIREFPEVELFGGGAVEERARGGLRELRHQALGLEAPEIEGRDQDGHPFKLSEYRGKVVLLYFWSEY